MNAIIESKRADLIALCGRRGVKKLELFGSAARADFDLSRSDFDFMVDLGDDPNVSPLDSYFGLKDDLESLLGRKVDLVSYGSVRNPYVKASIDRDKQLVFAR